MLILTLKIDSVIITVVLYYKISLLISPTKPCWREFFWRWGNWSQKSFHPSTLCRLGFASDFMLYIGHNCKIQIIDWWIITAWCVIPGFFAKGLDHFVFSATNIRHDHSSTLDDPFWSFQQNHAFIYEEYLSHLLNFNGKLTLKNTLLLMRPSGMGP